MNKLVVVVAALASVLVGCGVPDLSGVNPHYVDLPEDRTVLCVWEKSGYAGGLSCDWSNAS